MNTPENNTDTSGANRLEQLSETVSLRADAASRRQVMGLAAMGVLACVVIFGMSQINTLARSLDVRTITRMGGQHAAENLPEGRRALEQALAEQAPRLVREGMDVALESLPPLRNAMIEKLNGNLDVVNDEFVAATLEQLELGLKEARAAIARSHPDATPLERMKLVTRAAVDDFERDFDRALDELYPTYAMQMTQITEYVNYLAAAEPGQLSAEDQRKRDIIETMLQLIVRFREGQGDVL